MGGLNNKLNTAERELIHITMRQTQLCRVQCRGKAKGNMKGTLRNIVIEFGLTEVCLDV